MVATLLRPTQGGGSPQTDFYKSDAPLARTGLGRGERLNTDSNDAPVWKFENGSVQSDAYRQDNNGLIPPHKLTYTINKVFEQRFSPYKAIELFPVNREGGWNDYIEHYTESQQGRAAIVACANDFPRVNVNGKAFKTPTITIGTGYEVCYGDLKKAETAGLSYVERLTAAAKRALEQTMNAFAFYGDSRAGILGIANNPMLGQVVSPISLTDPQVDPLVILQLLQDTANSGYVSSGMANPKPDTLGLAPSVMRSISSRRISGLDKTTIAQALIESGAVQQLVEAPEFESLGANKSKLALFYRANNDSVEWRVPGSIEVLPPFWNGYGYEVNMIARVNSLWFYYPGEVVKLVGG